MKWVKRGICWAACIACVVAVKHFCHVQTEGFALYKILSELPPRPEWESPPLSADVSAALDQPFYYLAKGAQSYVFVSEDGQTVIKFFRLYHMRPPLWMDCVALPLCLQPYRVRKMLSKRAELEKDFESYQIAFKEMREETGLLYLHLNKTEHLRRLLVLHDKLKIAYHLDLDQMEFLVQKRATLVYPTIDALMQTEGETAAKEAISALVGLLSERFEKGIFDKDPDLNTNFGFLGRQPVQIDIGRFSRGAQLCSKAARSESLLRITDNFRQWLDSRYPRLSEHLLRELQTIREGS